MPADTKLIVLPQNRTNQFTFQIVNIKDLVYARELHNTNIIIECWLCLIGVQLISTSRLQRAQVGLIFQTYSTYALMKVLVNCILSELCRLFQHTSSFLSDDELSMLFLLLDAFLLCSFLLQLLSCFPLSPVTNRNNSDCLS